MAASLSEAAFVGTLDRSVAGSFEFLNTSRMVPNFIKRDLTTTKSAHRRLSDCLVEKRRRVLANQSVQLRLACSVGDSPTGGKVRNLRSLGRIRGGNETDEADRRSHPWDGERVTGP